MKEEMGGLMMPKEFIEPIKARLAAEIKALHEHFPGMEQDKLYIAMKEVYGIAESQGIDACDLGWNECAEMAKELMEARGDLWI